MRVGFFPPINSLMTEFYNLLILMVVIWTAGMLFRKIGLPEVFGELAGGIVVGPSLLGLVNPESEAIALLSELGIFFLMLHAGLKTEPRELQQASAKSLGVGAGAVVVPLGLGYLAGTAFGQPPVASLFIGMALAASAIPLGIRLIKHCKLEGTPLGHLAIGSAIVCDIAVLIGFSVLVGFLEEGALRAVDVARIIGVMVLFFTALLFLGTKSAPYLRRVFVPGNRSFTLTLIAALAIGLLAEAAGLHMVIGAFFAGLFIRGEVIDKKVFDKIEDRYFAMSYGLFGPIFFATLAFHLDFAALVSAPLLALIVTAAAVVGKIAGGGGVALLTGMGWRESLFTGLALNNRGSVELIIASVALSMGAIDGTVFSVLIVMTFATTVFSLLAAVPLARRIRGV